MLLQLNELTSERDMLIELHAKLIGFHKDSSNKTALDACIDIENLVGKLAILDTDDGK